MGNFMDKKRNNQKNEFVSIKSLRNECVKIYQSINKGEPLNITLK